MKFKYRKIDLANPFSGKKNILRPIIPVSLTFRNQAVRYEALIDSGSDFNIFPTEIGQKLKINLKKCRHIYFSGIEDSSVHGYIANVFISINHDIAKTNIVFADLPNSTGILGQQGFFDLFKVGFDLSKQKVTVDLKNHN